MSDRRTDLVRAASEGDPSALNELSSECAPVVGSFLERQMGPHLRRYVSAADLTQEALTRLPQVLPLVADGAGVDDVCSLLLQHARWVVLKAARSQREFHGESVLGVDGAERAAASRSTGDVTAEDQLRWLRERVSELPDDLGRVVQLRLADRSFREIAEECGISLRSAQERFMRAAHKLRPGTDA